MAAVHALQQLTVLLCHMYFKQNVSAKQSHVKILQLIIKRSTWVLKVCAKFWTFASWAEKISFCIVESRFWSRKMRLKMRLRPLLDNAPNCLFGSVIQKRDPKNVDPHQKLYLKGIFWFKVLKASWVMLSRFGDKLMIRIKIHRR